MANCSTDYYYRPPGIFLGFLTRRRRRLLVQLLLLRLSMGSKGSSGGLWTVVVSAYSLTARRNWAAPINLSILSPIKRSR